MNRNVQISENHYDFLTEEARRGDCKPADIVSDLILREVERRRHISLVRRISSIDYEDVYKCLSEETE